MFEQRLSLVSLGVADVGRARTFYEGLGWHASASSRESIAFFQLGGLVLALYAQTDLSADIGLSQTPSPGGITLAYNTQSRGEVDESVERFLGAGGTVLRAAFETEWGGYISYVADPDGHVWEIAFVEMLMPQADGTLKLPD